jgi:hypothetical protein
MAGFISPILSSDRVGSGRVGSDRVGSGRVRCSGPAHHGSTVAYVLPISSLQVLVFPLTP